MRLGHGGQRTLYTAEDADLSFHAIRRHWVLVLVVAGTAMLAALVAVSVRDTQYRASAAVLVSPLPQNDEGFLGTNLVRDSPDSSRTSLTVASLIETRRVASDAARRLGGGWTPDAVLGAVQVEPRWQTNIVTIKATGSKPALAARIANTVATSFFQVRRRELRPELKARSEQLKEELARTPTSDSGREALLRGALTQANAMAKSGSDPTLSLADTAAPPHSPSNVPAVLIAGVGLMGGLFLGAVSAMAVERLRRSVDSEGELLSLRPLPVLARVPRFPRRLRDAGPIAQVVRAPPAQEEFRTLAAQLEHRDDAHRTVLVTSASRGDGRTTVALGLALALTEVAYSVVLLDFDFAEAELSAALVPEGTHWRAPGANSGGDLSDHLVDSAVSPHLRILPAVPAADALPDQKRSSMVVLREARAAADYVVVDAPPLTSAGLALRAAGTVDDVVVVARPGHTSRQEYQLLLELLDGVDAAPAGLVISGQDNGLRIGRDASESRLQGPSRKRQPALVGSPQT